MKEIIAMHGWAGDSNQWSNWIDLFKCCDWEWKTAERGYKDIIPYMPKWNNVFNQNGLKRVAICHSLGSHLIDKRVLNSSSHVVLINSFSRFIPSGRERRSVTMALSRMMNEINTPNELFMLKKFYIKAHKPNVIDMKSTKLSFRHISNAGRLKLRNDLKVLINTDSLPAGLNTNAKVLLINSEKDFILSNQTKKKLAADLINYLDIQPTIINLKEEGHSISKIDSIKKIKHWLESDHEKKMV